MVEPEVVLSSDFLLSFVIPEVLDDDMDEGYGKVGFANSFFGFATILLLKESGISLYADIAKITMPTTGTTIISFMFASAVVRSFVIIIILFLRREGFEKLFVRLNALDLKTWLRRRLW